MILDLTRFEIVSVEGGWTWHCRNCEQYGRNAVGEAQAHRNYRTHKDICRGPRVRYARKEEQVRPK